MKIKPVFSENQMDTPEFIHISECETVGQHSTCSSLHSLKRDSKGEAEEDALSDVSGITDLFIDDRNDGDKVVIPIVPPCDAEKFQECLDSGPLPIESQLLPLAKRFLSNFSNFKSATLLDGCEQKADIIDDLLNRANDNLQFVNENITKLEQQLAHKQWQQPHAIDVNGEIRCPYKQLLNEFDQNGCDYVHAAYVQFEKKS